MDQVGGEDSGQPKQVVQVNWGCLVGSSVITARRAFCVQTSGKVSQIGPCSRHPLARGSEDQITVPNWVIQVSWGLVPGGWEDVAGDVQAVWGIVCGNVGAVLF